MERNVRLPPRFDAFDLVRQDDPYPHYQRLREAGPLCRGGPGQWLVTRYAEVYELLRDQRLGQFQFPDAYRLFPQAQLRDTLGGGPAAKFTERIIAGRDRPDHTRLRRLVGNAFSPRLVEGLRGHVRDVTDELLQRAARDREFDAVADLAFPVPLQVLCALLGIPPEVQDDVGRRVLRLARIFAPTLSQEDRVVADAAVEWLREYVGGLLDARRSTPGQDLLSNLAAALGDGQLEPAEAVDNAIFLIFAGLETSMNLLATGCALLAGHPHQFARLRANPALAPTAVEEVLRYDAPTQITGRIVHEPLEVAGQPIRPGRVVLLMLGAANHDPNRFPHADELDLGRDPNPHLSLGGGIHYCVGAALARLEGTVVFEELARRFDRIAPAAAFERERSATLRTYHRVPISARST